MPASRRCDGKPRSETARRARRWPVDGPRRGALEPRPLRQAPGGQGRTSTRRTTGFRGTSPSADGDRRAQRHPPSRVRGRPTLRLWRQGRRRTNARDERRSSSLRRSLPRAVGRARGTPEGRGLRDRPWPRGAWRSSLTRRTSRPSVSLDRADRAAPTPGERRQLTVMFCDVVGSTSLSQERDPELVARGRSGRYQATCDRSRAALRRPHRPLHRRRDPRLLRSPGRRTRTMPAVGVKAGLDLLEALRPVTEEVRPALRRRSAPSASRCTPGWSCWPTWDQPPRRTATPSSGRPRTSPLGSRTTPSRAPW